MVVDIYGEYAQVIRLLSTATLDYDYDSNKTDFVLLGELNVKVTGRYKSTKDLLSVLTHVELNLLKKNLRKIYLKKIING